MLALARRTMPGETEMVETPERDTSEPTSLFETVAQCRMIYILQWMMEQQKAVGRKPEARAGSWAEEGDIDLVMPFAPNYYSIAECILISLSNLG
jgi:hypothetical protein